MYQPTKLRDNTVTLDRRLDLMFDYDVRNRLFGVTHAPTLEPVNRLWNCINYFDQGTEGACAGFAAGHALDSEPIVTPTNQAECFEYYEAGKRNDHVEGENYEGTTLLGVAKGLKNELNLIDGYVWCFGLRDVIMTLGHSGPIVAGLNWTEGMHQPSADGLIRPTGRVLGGHAIMIQGVNVDYQYFVLHNSWGKDWGHGGNCYMLFQDFEYLLLQGGQAMFLKEIDRPVEVK